MFTSLFPTPATDNVTADRMIRECKNYGKMLLFGIRDGRNGQ